MSEEVEPQNEGQVEMMVEEENEEMSLKTLIIVHSYHHHNTEKVARKIASVLDAKITTPELVNPEELQEFDIIGFGSGIYNARHHRSLLDLAEKIPEVTEGMVFLFSTGALTSEKKLVKDHALLRLKLEKKGYTIIDEFQCKGYNTNSFMKYLGGMNKGRPNEDDLRNAKIFARTLKEYFPTE
jgi:flavodoxin